MRGLAFSHTAIKHTTSLPASSRGQHWNAPMQSSVQSPLISKKLSDLFAGGVKK